MDDRGRSTRRLGTIATLAVPPVLRGMGTHVTDHDLVAAVRGGDDRAFEQLYERYNRRITAYIQGMCGDHARAEDLTQDVFISALRRMRETERPIAFKPWIYEIAKNACIDQFRRTRRAEEVSYDADDATESSKLASSGPTPLEAIDTKQQLENLRGAFGGLSDAHHEILVMRELEGLSYRQIGEKLGMSRPSVESTLFRARRRLTEEYEELVSGERCRRVQSIISAAGEGRLGTRDQRRMARHVSHCQPCRRHAALAGLDTAALALRPVRTRIAALLPLPAFLRRRMLGGSGQIVPVSPTVAQASMAAANYAEPITTWTKAAAAAAAVAVAGLGAGVATQTGGGGGAHRTPPVERRAAARPASSTNAASSAVVSSQPAKGHAPALGSARVTQRREGGSGSGSSTQTQVVGGAGGAVSGATGATGSGATSGPVLDAANKLISGGGGGSGSTGTGTGSSGSSTSSGGSLTDTVSKLVPTVTVTAPSVGSDTTTTTTVTTPDPGQVVGTVTNAVGSILPSP
jgi:RNA polymerase sigma factor (sigma-70 family)